MVAPARRDSHVREAWAHLARVRAPLGAPHGDFWRRPALHLRRCRRIRRAWCARPGVAPGERSPGPPEPAISAAVQDATPAPSSGSSPETAPRRAGWVTHRTSSLSSQLLYSISGRKNYAPRSRRPLPSGSRAAEFQEGADLREFSPRPLGRPPNDLAAPDNDDAQHNPSINPSGDHSRAKHKHRGDHGEIIRSRVAAVGATAPSCIQDARRARLDESEVQMAPRRGAGTNKPARIAA
jgi:hypothetical protein